MTLIVFTFAYSQGKEGSMSEAEKAVIQARKDLLDADKRQDLKLMDSLLADDYVWINLNGDSGGKSVPMESLKNRSKDFSSTVTEEKVKIRVYNETAVVTGIMTIAFTEEGKSESMSGRFTQVWIKRQGRWQIVSLQGTPTKTK